MADQAWAVPSAAPSIEESDIEDVVTVLRSGILANGPQVAALEQDFSSYVDVPHSVAVSSGTTALVLAGQALGLGRRDTVLVSGFTFAASANAFLSIGCEVVPVDVDAVTMNMSAATLTASLARNPNARAVVVVDLYGSTVGTADAIQVARDAGLVVIEDACQAHGARTDAGPRVGSRADATTFSLYATKNMSGGEGGLVTTPDPAVADAIRRLRNHGGMEQYRHEVVGLNHRLPEVSATLARAQLRRLDEGNRRRAALACELAGWCRDAWGDEVATPPEAATATSDERHVFHQFTVRFRDRAQRDQAAAELRHAGVDARQFYPYTIGELPSVRPEPTPVAEACRDTVLSLPVHPGLQPAQRDHLRHAIERCSLAAVR